MNTVNFQTIHRLAIPAILSGLSEPIISLVDTAIVGRLDATAIGAVGLGSSLYLTMVWVFMSMGGAAAAIVGRQLGAGKEVRALLPQAVGLSLGIGGILLAIAFPFTEQLLQAFFKPQGTMAVEANAYISVRIFAFPFTLGTAMIFGIFKGYRNTTWAMWIALAGGAINLLLDVLLVFGVEGLIPAMGVTGAAAASMLAQVTMFSLAVVFLVRKVGISWHWQGRHPELFRLLRMSGDMVIRTVLLSGTLVLANRMATAEGDAALAAHSIAMQIWLFSAFFIDGYAHAGTAVMGGLLGGGHHAEIHRWGLRLCRAGVLIATALGVCYLAGYRITAPLFTDDAAVIQQFEAVYWLVILSQPVNGIAFIFDGVLIGLGRVVLLRNNLVLATVAGFIPVALLQRWLGLELSGVWWALLGWMLWRSFPLLWAFRRNFRIPPAETASR